MYKGLSKEIKKYNLDTRLHQLHKEGYEHSDFGMNNSSELLDGGFGLYSTVNTKTTIGPVKTSYYRIALLRAGSAEFTVGLETFHPTRNHLLFGFPGQIFSLQNTQEDFFAYYMLFTEHFIEEALLLKKYRKQFPFLSYAGVQCFPLTEEEGNEVETIYQKINQELKARKANTREAVQLYIQQILLIANRNYADNIVSGQTSVDSSASLFTRFQKLVSEHFLSLQKVGDYAKMLHVSADHLNRTIKQQADKTAHELINEMIGREAKAHLLHSGLSIAEIAYELGFSDPSHFNKFFKKLAGCTPLQFRNKSESDHRKS